MTHEFIPDRLPPRACRRCSAEVARALLAADGRPVTAHMPKLVEDADGMPAGVHVETTSGVWSVTPATLGWGRWRSWVFARGGPMTDHRNSARDHSADSGDLNAGQAKGRDHKPGRRGNWSARARAALQSSW